MDTILRKKQIGKDQWDDKGYIMMMKKKKEREQKKQQATEDRGKEK